MAEYVMESSQTGPDTPEQQEGQGLLAGKYKSQEDLEKGTLELLKKQANGDLESFYKNLESGKLGLNPTQDDNQDNNQDTQQDTQQDDSQQNPVESRQEAKNVLEQNGLKMEDFEQEFAQNGELSQDSYDKLSQVFPKAMVDSYIEGQKALMEKAKSEITSIAGGEEAYQDMVEWASKNLSKQQIQYFNEAVESGDLDRAKFAVSGLAAQYKAAQGNEPDLVEGKGNAPGVSGYQSKQEMIRDMQDSRYSKDPAFRQQVDNKLKNTTAF